MKRTFGAGIVFASMVALFASVAAAADGKAYSGLSCVEQNDSTPAIIYVSGSYARNSDSGSNSFRCAAVRDNMGTDMDVLDWQVQAQRNGSTDVWDFTLWSVSSPGSGWTSTLTIPGGSGVKTITGTSVTSASDRGPLFLTTTVPAGADVISYYIEES